MTSVLLTLLRPWRWIQREGGGGGRGGGRGNNGGAVSDAPRQAPPARQASQMGKCSVHRLEDLSPGPILNCIYRYYSSRLLLLFLPHPATPPPTAQSTPAALTQGAAGTTAGATAGAGPPEEPRAHLQGNRGKVQVRALLLLLLTEIVVEQHAVTTDCNHTSSLYLGTFPRE